jgi:hypothetical protein
MPLIYIRSYNAVEAAKTRRTTLMQRLLRFGSRLTWVEKLIMLRSKPHVHTELQDLTTDLSCSATMQDGAKCFRRKLIFYTHLERWTTHIIYITEEQRKLMLCKAKAMLLLKVPYDLIGLLSFGTPLEIIKPSDKGVWCTEAVAILLNAAGIETPPPDTLHPQGFVEWLDKQGYERVPGAVGKQGHERI